MSWRRHRSLVIMQCLVLASCTTIGPTISVSPAQGKAPDAFAEDRRACMASTDASLQLLATGMNLSATSTDDMAAGNARIQVMYDDRFGRCMSARGNAVLASAASPRQQPATASPSFEAAAIGSQDLGDAASAEAEHALAPLIASMRHDCDGEDIVAHARAVRLSSGDVARIVALTEPHGGSCFGEPGENDYLVERHGDLWAMLLAAEPGSITVLPGSRSGHADVELHSLGLCVYRYGWKGGGYAIVGSHDCALPAPPTTGTLPGLLR